MNWTLPGSTLQVDLNRPEAAKEICESLFIAGGLVLSQVCQITGLEPYTVQNWVKRGFLTHPENKKYNCDQLCRLLIINTLKTAMPMESVCRLLSYINGRLNDTSDDIIPDSKMYFIFTRLASTCSNAWSPADLERVIETALAQNWLECPNAEAQKRVAQVLEVIANAWFASQFQKRAVNQLTALGL